MIPINHFAYASKSDFPEDERTLFECRADKNYKLYILMMLSVYFVIAIMIISFVFFFSDNSDDMMTTLVPVVMILIYICYEYIVDTIKISRNHYRLTNLQCIISSKYLVSNFASIPYTKITKYEILVRPWQDWFGLATVRIAEKNVSPIENWSGEDYIRLVSKSDAQIIMSILKQHIKIKKH